MDDRNRTLGLCRDRAATKRKLLKSNGVGRHGLKPKDIVSHCYHPILLSKLIAVTPRTDFSSRKLGQLVSAGYGFERSGPTLPLGANFKSSS